MKKTIAAAFLAGSLATSAHAENLESNICESNKIIADAKNKIFVLIQGPETKQNNLTYCRNGEMFFQAPIATGKPHPDGGVYTPEWNFTIGKLDKNKTSGSYKTPNGKRAPMPNAVHVHKWIWIHQGRTHNSKGQLLKYPSHGCIRLGALDSELFFSLMEMTKENQEKVEVIIRGTNPKTPN